MGQDGEAIFNQPGPKAAQFDGCFRFSLVYLDGFLDQSRLNPRYVLCALRYSLHAFHGVKEVAGGGSGGGDSPAHPLELLEKIGF